MEHMISPENLRRHVTVSDLEPTKAEASGFYCRTAISLVSGFGRKRPQPGHPASRSRRVFNRLRWHAACHPRNGNMSTPRQDLGYALRGLYRNRGFAAVAILTIGIGIGANTTVYSWMRALLVNPLPG